MGERKTLRTDGLQVSYMKVPTPSAAVIRQFEVMFP